MLSFDAVNYAMKYAKAHETDKLYQENNTEMGLLNQVQEEMGECIAAIGKYKRTIGEGPITPVTKEEAINNVIEELTDSLAMIAHVAEKMGWCDQIIKIHLEKSEQCAKRILDKKKQEEESGEAV